jgi:hypothetical protein
MTLQNGGARMASKEHIKPRVPFKQSDECHAFDQALTQHVSKLLDQKRSELIPAENVEHYSHGRSWRSHASYRPDEISEVQTHGHEFEIKFTDIVENKVEIIPRIISETVKNMNASMMRMIFQNVDEACQSSGNVVNRQNGQSNADAFLQMLRTIEFGVDRDGNPSLPSMHASPQAIDAMLKDLKSQGPEFEAEFERIKAEKISAALEQEKERRKKFLAHPDT